MKHNEGYLVRKEFSYSSIDMFLQCPKRFHLHYVEKNRPKQDERFLAYGLAVHETLEEFYLKKREGITLSYQELVAIFDKKFKDEHKTEYLSDYEMLDYYLRGLEYLKLDPFEGYEIVGIEEDFRLEIHGEVIIGFIDLILKDKEGNFIVVDHKTSSKVFDKKKLTTNLQMPIYFLAIKQKYGKYPVKGVFNFTKLMDLQSVSFTDKEMDFHNLRLMGIFNLMRSSKWEFSSTPLCMWCPYGNEASGGTGYCEDALEFGLRAKKDTQKVSELASMYEAEGEALLVQYGFKKPSRLKGSILNSSRNRFRR